jgi:ribose transport system substrate-binding protein
LLQINQPDLDAWLKTVPEGGVVNAQYPQDLVGKIIDANADKTALPAVPAPK